jgi:hypothetical protein
VLVPTHAVGHEKQAERGVGIVGVFIPRAAQADVGSVSEFDHEVPGVAVRGEHDGLGMNA